MSHAEETEKADVPPKPLRDCADAAYAELQRAALERPLLLLGAAVGAGLLLGLLLQGRSRR